MKIILLMIEIVAIDNSSHKLYIFSAASGAAIEAHVVSVVIFFAHACSMLQVLTNYSYAFRKHLTKYIFKFLK